MNNSCKSALDLRPTKSAKRVKAALLFTWLVTGVGLPEANVIAQPTANVRPDTATVNCPGQSIQTFLDRNNLGSRGTLKINGTCTEDVLITQDNVTFIGSPGATISGTITVDGARRVVFQSLTITGTGNGIVVTRNGTATVQESIISENDDSGILVEYGAHADILNNSVNQNGQNVSDLGDQGKGIWVNFGGKARVINNSVSDNLSEGITVRNGSTVQLESNEITGNGRMFAGESGLGVFRARVRANGNVYRDNAFAAIDASNDASYRTGTFLNSFRPDNSFGFEIISARLGQPAIFISRGTYVDLRQIIVEGAININHDSTLLVRGDDVGPATRCAEVDDVIAGGANSVILLQGFTRVNGVVVADSNQGNRLASNTGCSLP